MGKTYKDLEFASKITSEVCNLYIALSHYPISVIWRATARGPRWQEVEKMLKDEFYYGYDWKD